MYEEFMGTKPVSERQKFDLSALQEYMGRHVDGFSGTLTIEQFKGGQSNPTFKLTANGQRYVLRTKPGPAAKLLPRRRHRQEIPPPHVRPLARETASYRLTPTIWKGPKPASLLQPEMPTDVAAGHTGNARCDHRGTSRALAGLT